MLAAAAADVGVLDRNHLFALTEGGAEADAEALSPAAAVQGAPPGVQAASELQGWM